MIINKPIALSRLVVPSEITKGTVFSGKLNFNGSPFFDSGEVRGFFWRIQSHILNLDNHELYGCGLSGGSHTPFRVVSVSDYQAFPNTTLEIK